MPSITFFPTDSAYLEKLNAVAAAYDGALLVSDTLDAHIAGTADKHAASAIVNTPAGNIAATDVQGALNELDAADASVLAAAESYADGLVTGLWDDRGSYNASGNTFPSSGGSGSAGAIMKGDIWTISTGGTLGGHVVLAGDTVRALIDSPGSTDSNWAIAEGNLGYAPENPANKDASGGYPGLTLFKLNLRNAANTITSWFTTAATVARTWTMPDRSGTVALTADYSDSGGSALVGFLQAGAGAVTKTIQAKLRETVSVKDFGALGDDTADDGPAIQSAIDYLDTLGGGVLFFPAGIYLTSQSIYQRNYVSLEGSGSRSSFIKWGAASSVGLVKGVVYSVHGTDGSPDYVFSTSISSLHINGDGIATIGYACRGWQEQCSASDVVVSGCTTVQFDIMPFTATAHQATFEDLHLIPNAGSTAAIALRGSDISNCNFRNITTAAVLDATSNYAKGLYLYGSILLNTFENIHNENAVIGIDLAAGAGNTFTGIEGLCNQVAGTTHFNTATTRHVIQGMRTNAGYTNHYVGPNATIAAGAAEDSAEIVSGASYFKRTADTLTENATYGASLMRGVYSRAGIAGDGETLLRLNDYVGVAATRYVILNLGASAIGFSGKLNLRGVGSVRASTEAHFGGYADTGGAVLNASVSTATSNVPGALLIGAPVALSSPTSNFIRIPITEAAGFAQAYEITVSVSRAGGQAVAITVGS